MSLAYAPLVTRPRTVAVPPPPRPADGANTLLKALGADLELLTPHLRRAPLVQGETLHQPGEPVRFVDFPVSGAVGLASDSDGEGAPDAALIGRDGVVGAVEVLAGASALERAVVRQSGASLRMEAARLRELADRVPALRTALDACAARLQGELRRTVACAAGHRLDGRLATWIVRCRERSGAEVLAVRQEELADALGVQRTSVNAAAQALQLAGALRTGRGRIMVTDEPVLRRRACSCLRQG